jgi:hypothetical protein
MVNLITPALRRSLTTTYYIRLTTAASLAVAGALLVALFLLVPSYLFIHAEADQAEAYVTTATAIADERAKNEAPDTLQTFNEELKALKNIEHTPLFAKVVSVITGDIPRGVSLNKIDVENKGASAAITISGSAQTRAQLIAYADQLRHEQGMSNVIVPVSDLVADVDSSFSVSATYTPQP